MVHTRCMLALSQGLHTRADQGEPAVRVVVKGMGVQGVVALVGRDPW